MNWKKRYTYQRYPKLTKKHNDWDINVRKPNEAREFAIVSFSAGQRDLKSKKSILKIKAQDTRKRNGGNVKQFQLDTNYM